MSCAAKRCVVIVDWGRIRVDHQEMDDVVGRALDAGMRVWLFRAKEAAAPPPQRHVWHHAIERVRQQGGLAILHDSTIALWPQLAGHNSLRQHWSMGYVRARMRQRVASPAKPDMPNATPPWGASTHTLEELRIAERLGASWAFASPFAQSLSKPGYGPCLGERGLRTLCASTTLPIFALGGMNPHNVDGAARAGAAGVAVMGMLSAPRAAETMTALLARIEEETWIRQTPW